MTEASGNEFGYPPLDEDPVHSTIRWRRRRAVSRSFPVRSFLARFTLAFLPPVRRRTIANWALIAGGIALGWVWVWFVGTRFVGAADLEVQLRWSVDLSGLLILGIGVFLPSIRTDTAERTADIRAGAVVGAAIIGYKFALERDGRTLSVRLVAIRSVRRLFGVVAIELPNGHFSFVPNDLFPSRPDWAKVQAMLSSN